MKGSVFSEAWSRTYQILLAVWLIVATNARLLAVTNWVAIERSFSIHSIRLTFRG